MPKQETTANNAQVAKKVTQEEANAFDLAPHLIRLMWDEPFFASVLRGIEKIKTEEIPTAGVLAKDGYIRFGGTQCFLPASKLERSKV